MAKMRCSELLYPELKNILRGFTITPLSNENGIIDCRIVGGDLPKDDDSEVVCFITRHVGGVYTYEFYSIEAAHRVCDVNIQGGVWS